MSSGHLDLEGLFLVNGNAERVDWLRQRYDSGEEVELEKEADLASAVSLLRLFLQELPEPVIPTAMQGHILQLHQGVWRGHNSLFSRLSCSSELTTDVIFLFCFENCSSSVSFLYLSLFLMRAAWSPRKAYIISCHKKRGEHTYEPHTIVSQCLDFNPSLFCVNLLCLWPCALQSSKLNTQCNGKTTKWSRNWLS